MNENRNAAKGEERAGARRLVVVGYGPTAHRLVETLLDRGFTGAVTVFGEEPRPAYDRVALTSYLDGKTLEDLTYPVPDGVSLRVGERVTAIDRDNREVVTDAGAREPYDLLVLATGSAPFVPPVPGRELPGCFVYRTIDDLDAIRDAADGAVSGVVIGGGLLGLEAADALRGLGLRTHVVEMSPWLMPRQVDEGGGSVLRGQIEALGLGVHTGAGVRSIEAGPDGRVSALVKPDGEAIEAQVVVFSAGIRPRDELARASGLEVGERGGIVVDEGMRTGDEHIYAVGECALAGGMVYGLVGPCFTQAEVAADRILGGTASFEGADMSTKLKLLGVEVAQFGAMSGALDVTYMDPVGGVYKRLFISDDAQTLLGGVCVGDAAPYNTLRPFVGRPLPGAPSDLLFAGAGGGTSADLPDDAQVCSCNNVTKGQITAAIVENGLTDVPGIKKCTRAGTTCGSCLPMLKQILVKSGVDVGKALCEHFPHSRAELFDIISVRGITTFSQLIAEHGTGRGCDICKPAVASILASLGNGHILDGEQAALQDTNDHFLANIQKNGTYSVVPRVPGGEITPDKLIVIGEVARDFGLYTKITGAQRIDLLGARVEQLPAIWRRLVDAGFESGHAYGKALRTVKSCVGSTWCRYGVQDSVGLAIALELRYRGLRSPHKLKSAVSGCARECAEARSKDFGIIATEQGWNLYVAGNGGFKPRHADLLAADLSTEELVRTIDRFLMFYIRTADRLQRTAAWLEGLEGGLDYLRSVIMDDSLGICADLDAQMARHTATYVDEWRAAIEDPDKLRRFVSFVNAPDVPDPSITFETERDQIKPVLIPLEVARR
ncbi:nitrite reductase large subunit [Microbispora sp. RL4-1S]|uniref:assimilatory sulfite reductase (ferredoxin) n=1 Tax=Microbispora oryzae TaxID=2806554 RepID=A0A941AIZ2_9ACTN|nr:nitrite reductase large subunit NirB [Microbispora oryzae]MBP2703648.1 nitrite reductase large subunit [Microbispora oryzae]